MDSAEDVVKEALSAWQDGAELLDSLPSLSPDHETVRIAVANLRAVYEQTVARRPHGASALAKSREHMASAVATLDAVRVRQAPTVGPAGLSGSLIDQVERTLAQAEELLTQMPPYSAEYERISNSIVELRQIEAMAGAGPGLGPKDAVIRRSIIETQRSIAQAADGNRKDGDGRQPR